MKKKKKAVRENVTIGKEKKKIDKKLVIKLLISFFVIFSVYFTLMKVAEIYGILLIQKITFFTYIGAITLLGSLYVIFNRGVSRDVPTESDLPDTMSKEEKEEFIKMRLHDREKAKKVLIFLLPFVVTLLVDVINVFYF